MTFLKKNVWTWLKEYTLITVGVLLYVMGWIIFLVPNNMIGGGVTGLGSIVQYATGGVIKIGYTYFVVNAGLLVAALFTLGRSFGAKSISEIACNGAAPAIGIAIHDACGVWLRSWPMTAEKLLKELGKF